ncbi:MAG: hypothetical protein P1U89_25010 [Verrucomicrobiales bacterium]|nr:hypothetical protein [Verrucomicrobiales bacterium]
MSDNEKLQKLLRLKNYETPGEEYFDDFLDQLKKRQRQDALKQSALVLLKERVVEWYRELGSAKWAVPAGSFAALAVTLFTLGGKMSEEELSLSVQPEDAKTPKSEPQLIELQLPSNTNSPRSMPSQGGSSVLPAAFGGYREL